MGPSELLPTTGDWQGVVAKETPDRFDSDDFWEVPCDSVFFVACYVWINIIEQPLD